AMALAGGVNWLMLRIHDLPASVCIDIASELRRMARQTATLFSVNPYPVLAEWVEADGVHLPEHALEHPLAPSPNRLLGYSVHSEESAPRAVAAGADYLLVGTMYPTSSHPNKSPEGIPLMRAIARAVSVPLIAVGGITPERVSPCLQAGAIGVAVISGILGSPNPSLSAQAYWSRLVE
ncbi:MAG: thiamine phosphate synthase, partial [Armatimonadota bacterium]